MSPRIRLHVAMTLLVLGALATHLAAPARAAAIDVYLTVAPPREKPVEVEPPARPGYLWEADRWQEQNGRYRFIPGHWIR